MLCGYDNMEWHNCKSIQFIELGFWQYHSPNAAKCSIFYLFAFVRKRYLRMRTWWVPTLKNNDECSGKQIKMCHMTKLTSVTLWFMFEMSCVCLLWRHQMTFMMNVSCSCMWCGNMCRHRLYVLYAKVLSPARIYSITTDLSVENTGWLSECHLDALAHTFDISVGSFGLPDQFISWLSVSFRSVSAVGRKWHT